MYKRPIIPAGFTPPARADGPGFHLRMLTIHDAVKDFDAVMATAGRLKGFLEPGATWPDGLTLEENLIDLAWHQREFTVGHSFAYTVMNDDESRCLGCGYINPADQPEAWPGYDAVAFYWARAWAKCFARSWPGFPSPKWRFPAVTSLGWQNRAAPTASNFKP